MDNDLVKDLRFRSRLLREGLAVRVPVAMEAAANRIEELERERKDFYKETMLGAEEQIARAQAESARLRSELQASNAYALNREEALDESQRRKERAEAESARLRGALEGIANMPEHDQDDAHRLRHTARAALDKLEAP